MCQVFDDRADRFASYFPIATNHRVWLARKLEVWKWHTMKCRTTQGLECLHFILSNKAKENTLGRESVCANGSLRGKIKPCTIKWRHNYVENRNVHFFVKKKPQTPVCFVNNKEVIAKGVKVEEVISESEGNDVNRPAVTYQREWAWIPHISSVRMSSRIPHAEERFVQIEMATTALGSGSESGSGSGGSLPGLGI